MQHSDVLDRHERIALQVSGGKDSLACLYMLKPYWDRLTVYWTNTGDAFPEVIEIMDQIRSEVPHFIEIKTDVAQVHEDHGMPSDIVPESATPFGIIVGHESPLIQGRYSCCFTAIMRPMHERMIADGITLVIRGQRMDDTLKSPVRSGDVVDGIEFYFPIEHMTKRDVMSYLAKVGAPIPRFYEVMDTAPDCMSCSAYWEDGRAIYLKRYHHDAYLEYQRRMNAIKEAVTVHINHFNTEVTP